MEIYSPDGNDLHISTLAHSLMPEVSIFRIYSAARFFCSTFFSKKKWNRSFTMTVPKIIPGQQCIRHIVMRKIRYYEFYKSPHLHKIKPPIPTIPSGYNGIWRSMKEQPKPEQL